MTNNYIIIEGNIGSGKTSLAKLLSEKLGGKLMLEEFEENPFLKKFYKDPSRYAFQLELSFLAERFQQIQTEIQNRDLFQEFMFSDYMIEKCLIFSKNNLDHQSIQLYRKLYDIIQKSIPKPDLIIYLHKDSKYLLSNIGKRARDYEQDIKAKYLEDIYNNYITYFKQQNQYPVLFINTNEIDFVEDPTLIEYFVELINKPFKIGLHPINLR